MSVDPRVLNERMFRAANDVIERNRGGSNPGGLHLFLCECSALECRENIELTSNEYASVRRDLAHFALAPGHEDPHERVFDEFDRYTVVAK